MAVARITEELDAVLEDVKMGQNTDKAVHIPALQGRNIRRRTTDFRERCRAGKRGKVEPHSRYLGNWMDHKCSAKLILRGG